MIGLRGAGGARRIGLAGAAAILLAMAGGDVRAQAPAGAPPPAGPPPVPVTVAAVLRKDVPILLRNIGTVQAFQTVLMRARIDGTLDQLFFDEGQEVKRGDKLALIDPRPYQAALDQALAKKSSDEALLANARLDLTRSVELALCSLRAGLTLNTFLALPNVTKENDAVIFTTTIAAVHLRLAELHATDGEQLWWLSF